jgi:hypothetical protein
MSTNRETTGAKDRKVLLSTLWIFVVFDYLYVDLAMVMFRPEIYQRIAARMNEGIVLAASVLMEIPIAMILLSRVLKYRANRWANIVAGVVSTAFAAFPLFTGKPPAFYLLFSAVESAGTLFIVWYAWTWPRLEAQVSE